MVHENDVTRSQALAPYAVTAAAENSRSPARGVAAGAPRKTRCAPRAARRWRLGSTFQCPIRRRRLAARAHLHSLPLGAPHGTHMYGAARQPAAVGCTQGRAGRRVLFGAFPACPERRLRRAAHPSDTRGRAPPRCRLRTHAASVARRLACARARRGTTRGGWKEFPPARPRARTRRPCAARQRAAQGVLNAVRASAAASAGACVAAASCPF
jgi:hypothetical protein